MTRRSAALQLRRLTDSIWGAMLGALVYAAWAVFANWDFGMRIALTAGLVHWLASTVLTYTGTGVMRRCFAAVDRRLEGAVITFIGGLAYTYILLLAVHHLLGTPHIALTLAAGVIPNILFCSSYALLLARTTPAASNAPTVQTAAQCNAIEDC